MEATSKRATVYLSPEIFKAVKLKAVETSRSVSDLINEALRHELAEDAEDISALEERRGEPSLSFESFVKKLKADGKI